jgi:hypothetical protein
MPANHSRATRRAKGGLRDFLLAQVRGHAVSIGDMPVTAPPALAARLARLIGALCETVAARIARPGRPGLAGPLIVAICARLHRMAQRVIRLAVAVEAGTLAAPRRRPAASRNTVARRRLMGTTLPRGFAWLVRRVPGIGFGTQQLQALLDEPEMQALIEAAPQICRTLRPLCHMLGLRPLPPILRRSGPAPPRRTAACRKPPPAEPPPAEPPRMHRLPPAQEIAHPAGLRPISA